ncbi:hypothetical protein EDB85DRAFT_1159578 [Lactarius pseudohatsudake]|nr:hypothetical protein EDB85DRAFT_1159578 [Lactarius pseudohatsudake]
MSPVPLHVSPASTPGDVLSIQNLLDSLGADTILQSRDLCEIRVPELYIARFSPVLGALIRDTSNSTIPGNADAPLLVVQLPESGATLISLLSFIFPLSPTLPPTSAIEDTMKLLSAAQKYELSSVLAHMRLCLAQRDPPFYPQRQRIPCIFPRSEVRIASRGEYSRESSTSCRVLTFMNFGHSTKDFGHASGQTSKVSRAGSTISYQLPYIRSSAISLTSRRPGCNTSRGAPDARIVGAYRLRSSVPYGRI